MSAPSPRAGAPALSDIFGPATWPIDSEAVAAHLADQMLHNHWHVDDLPWGSLAPLPIPPRARDPRKLVRFYKSAVAVQTQAEEIAVSIARRLLLHADDERLGIAVRRAIAAVLNDEASHVATMVKLEAVADVAYPGVSPRSDQSPLFEALMPAIETLEPSVLAIFMASYEASVAIRSYAEAQTYRVPSILALMGRHAAQDDGRHAKTLRIVAHEFLEIFRSRFGDDEGGRSPAWRESILDPFRRFWTLMPDHELYLAGSDRRQLRRVREQVEHDVAIMTLMLDFLGVSRQAQAYGQVGAITGMLTEPVAAFARV